MMLKETQVASTDMIMPSCSLQHKVLKFSSDEDFTQALYILLQFPAVRLKELTIRTSSKYFHLCAIHPDLEAIKLMISVEGGIASHRRHLATLQQDTASLFKNHCLQKICISGDWGSSSEVKLGIIHGLQGR